MMTRFITTTTFVILIFASFTVFAQSKAQKPNFILIVSDDLGFADLNLNGSKQIATPNIDRLAEEGVNFTQGYVSAPFCSPSRAGLLTGRNQVHFGHDNNMGGSQPGFDPQYLGLPLSETTNATHLANLFLKYKEAKFVIFHGSYPYMSELTVLAKKFPNVYIDMCWMHIISPAASRQYLEEWLLTVPSNKIMAFGGDFGDVVEGTYGHSVIARKNVAEVLTKLVGDGYYSEEGAILIAKRILRENALELYKLKKVGDYFERSE